MLERARTVTHIHTYVQELTCIAYPASMHGGLMLTLHWSHIMEDAYAVTHKVEGAHTTGLTLFWQPRLLAYTWWREPTPPE